MTTTRLNKLWAVCLLLTASCLLAMGANAQSADLIIQKMGPAQVNHNAPMSYTIEITNNGPDAVTNASFADAFVAPFTNVTFGGCTATGGATCPTSSNFTISNSSFNGTVPYLPVNGKVTMIINMNSPATTYTPTSFTNTATVSCPAGINEVNATTNTSTINTTLNKNIDLSTTTTAVGGSLNCTFPKTIQVTNTYTNNGPSAISGSLLTGQIDFIKTANSTYSPIIPVVISNITWTSTGGATVPTNTTGYNGTITFNSGNTSGLGIFSGGGAATITNNFPVGATITLTYTVTLNTPTNLPTSCGQLLEMTYQSKSTINVPSGMTETNSSNNNASSPISNLLSCSTSACTNIDLSTTTTAVGGNADCTFPKTIQVTNTYTNNGPAAGNGALLTGQIDFIKTANSTYSPIIPVVISNITWTSTGGATVPTNTTGYNGTISFNSGNTSGLGIFSGGGAATITNNFPVGATITLTYTVTLNTPTNLPTSCGQLLEMTYQSKSTINVPSGMTETNSSNNNASSPISNLLSCSTSACPNIDLSTTTTAVGGNADCTFPKTIQVTNTYTNNGPAAGNGALLTGQIDFIKTANSTYSPIIPVVISNITWTSTGGATVPTNTTGYNGTISFNSGNTSGLGIFSGGGAATITNNFPVGATITLTYTVTLNTPTNLPTSCGQLLEMTYQSKSTINVPSGMTETNSSNNNASSPISNLLSVTVSDLSISKSVNPIIINSGNTQTQTTTVVNSGGGTLASTVVWRDTLPNTFTINTGSITCTASGGATCSTVSYNPTTHILTQTLINMPAGGQVVISYTGTVNSLQTITEYTRAYVQGPCIDCVPSTNATVTNYQINGSCNIVADAGIDKTITCTTPSAVIGSAAISGTTYSWSPATGLSSSNIAQPTATPTTTTTYTVTATGSSCAVTDVVIVTVDKTPPTANAGTDKSLTCTIPSAVLGSASVAGYSYSWSPATGLSSTTIAQPTTSANSTITYTVTVTSSNGCTAATDAVLVTVNKTPPTANAGTDKSLTCTTASAVLGSAAVAGNTYSWSPATGLSSSTSAQPTTTATTTTTYTLTVTNANNCTATDVVVVTVDKTAPTANAGANKTLNCTTTSATIGTATVAGNSYSWSPATGLSSTTIAQPIASPVATTTYTVTVTGSNGCTATDAVLVTVNATIATVGNYVWNDVNHDGLNNESATEGINGVTVELWNASTNALVSTTTTTSNGANPGYYLFSVCTSGSYFIKFPTTVSGKSLTIQTTTAAIDNNSDANLVDGKSPTFTLNPAGTGVTKNNLTIDAGYYNTCPVPNCGTGTSIKN